jgi:hypothetical protein
MSIPKLIFIVPYRARKPQKTHFSIYMKYILEDYNSDDYKIFFVHQMDNRSFNRGAMKNIGFLVSKNLYPNDYKNITFIFNDIDTIPCEKNILNYETTKGTVKHFYGFKFALGGIFSINGLDFEKCNGFPNFWGWGLEDNVMNKRVINNNINIDRSQFFTIGNIEIMQQLDKPFRLINDRETTAQTTNEGLKDIKNLQYKIEDEMIQVSKFNTAYEFNTKEFYSRDISVPGAQKSLINVLTKKENNKYTQNLFNNNIKQNNLNMWKMY